MKFVLALLLAVGAASATQPWTPGKEYVYEYKTRTMTGIPGLKNQAAGVGLRAKVIVQVNSPSELLVKMADVSMAKAENEIFSSSPLSWRKELELQYSPIEVQHGLSTPFKVILNEGKVQELEVSRNEPVWVVNIKRGLVSKLSLNLSKIQQQSILASQNKISQEPEQMLYVEQEPSVTGRCRTYYTIVPLPEYIAKSQEYDLQQEIREQNQDRPAFVITKTKDFTFCSEKPSFIHSSTVDHNEEGSSPSDAQHKRFSSRTAIHRYLIRGEPMHKFVIERVWSEGEFVVRPFATNTESLLVNSNQTLVLKKKEQISSRITVPTNTVRKGLVFQIFNKHQQEQSQQEEQDQYNQEIGQQYNQQYSQEYQQEYDQEYQQQYNQQYSSQWQPWNKQSAEYPKLTKAPYMAAAAGQNVPAHEVKEQIRKLVDQVEEDIESSSQKSEKELANTVLKISQALSVLDLEEMKQVYREVVPEQHPSQMSQKTKKQVILDALVMAGTNPALLLVKELILKKEVKGEQAAQLLLALPVSVKTPTPELISELVQLVREVKQANEYEQIWMTGLLAVSNILNRACVNPLTRRHNFAVSPYTQRPYCTPKDVQLLLPFLRKELHQTSQPEKVTVIIQAIGNLGSHEVFDVLRPYIQGRITADKQIRSKAIFALHRMVQVASESLKMKVRSLLKPIFASPVEEPEVRQSAFIGILSSRPSEAFFTEAATGTWFEPSQQVGQFVHSTLAAIANSTYPVHQNMTRKAAMALPLTKQFNLGAHYSQYVLASHVIPERRIGSLLQWAHFGSKHSLIPEQSWFSLRNYLGGFDVPIIESSLQAQGIQRLINRFLGPQERNELSSGLNIHTRKDFPIQGSLWIKGMGQMERVFTMETLRELAIEGIVEFTSHKELTINYQKTLPLEDVVMVFPIGSGLPITVTRKTPLFISIRGRIELQMDQPQMSIRKNLFPKEIKVKMDLKPILSLTRKIETGIACPITKKVFKAGHKTNTLLSLPGKLELIYQNNQLEIVAKRAQQLGSKVELISVRSFPYTAHTKFYNFLTQETKTIRVQNQEAQMKKRVGQKYFGLAFELEGNLDQPFNDMAGLYQLLKPHTALSASQFALVPHTLRYVNYNLKLDLSQSQTEQVRAKIIYEAKSQQFSLHGMEEEERLQGIYYKNQETQQFQNIRSKSQSFMNKPWETVAEEEQYFAYPTKSLEGRRSAYSEEEQIEGAQQQLSKSRSLHAEIAFEGTQTRRYRASSVLAFSPCMTKAKFSGLFEREGSSELRSFKAVVNGQINFPKLPFQRSQILDAQKTAMGHLSVQFGAEAEHEITARLVLGQTQQWREAVASSHATKECEKYEQVGAPYTAICLEAIKRAQGLNKIVLDVESQNLPRQLLNMTLQANDLVKAALYPYMSNKAMGIQNAENKIKLVAVQEPQTSQRPWTVFNIFWYKPQENTFFQHIKASPVAEAFLPITAEYSIMKKAFNNLMGQQYTPFCEIQRELITTFDNVTYKYPIGQCWHLVAKDCSKQIPIQIFAKESSTQGNKFVKIQAGQYTAELLSEKEVKVNGEIVRVQVQSEEKVIRNEQGRPVFVIYRPKQQKLVLVAQIHGVKILYDGKNFQVQMSNMYRGRVCGLCGDMNGEKAAELKDPQGCIRNNWNQFGRSYASGSCADKSVQALETAECMREYTVIPSNSYHHQQGSSSSTSGLRYHNKVLYRNGDAEVCFSVKPVPECQVGFKPTEHMTKEIGFHCVRRGRTSNEMMARARSGVLEELLNKSADFTEFVSIPEACQPISAY